MRRGTRVGQAYVAVAADGSGVNEDIVDAVDEAGDGVEKSGEDHGERYGDGFGKGLGGRIGRIRGNLAKGLSERLGRAGTEAGENAGDRVGESLVERASAKAKDLGDRISSEIGDRMASRPEQMRRGIDRAFDDEFADRVGSRFAKQFVEQFGDTLRGAETQLAAIGAQLSDSLEKSVSRNVGGRGGSRSDLIGRLFGAGSRNNALNLFGRSIGGVSKLISGLASSITGMVSTFRTGFAQAAEGATGFARIFQGALGGATSVGSSFAKTIGKSGPAALAALALAAAAAIPTLSVLVSVLSAMLALVTALAATIVSALVGALAVGTGAFLAIAGAAGLATAAFMSMTDAQKDMLSTAFTPLRNAMTGLGQIMITQMVPAFRVWSENLQRALVLAVPVARVMGRAFADAGKSLTAAFSGPGFQLAANALGVYLPSIVRRLSRAFGGFLNGVAGVFAALLPQVNRFAGYLARVARDFAKWATSAQGQNAITDFVNRAVASLRSLWNFVKQVAGFIGDVLFSPQAQGAGNSLFDWLATSFQTFRKNLDRWIKNGTFEEWLSEGIVFAGALADIIGGLGDLVQSLNSSGVLAAFAIGISGIAGQFELLAIAIYPVVKSLGTVGNLLGKLGGYLGLESGAPLSPFTAENMPDTGGFIGPIQPPGYGDYTDFGSILDDLLSSGSKARGGTSKEYGGTAPGLPTPQEYVNPYAQWAQSIINEGPSITQQIAKAMDAMNKAVQKGLTQAGKAGDRSTAVQSINDIMRGLRESGRSLVTAARDAVNSAASALSSAGSAAEVNKALAVLVKAQKDLRKARAAQEQLEKDADYIAGQRRVRNNVVNKLTQGQWLFPDIRRQNATLAEYAAARARVARQMERANQQLVEAIQMRADYRSQVEDSIKSFGSLISAEAQVIDGVEQALTATDITKSMEERLKQIKTFRDNLRILVGQGLSNDAYQALVDAGVEQGGAYAQALVEGGVGSIQDVNNLVGQTNSIAEKLGKEASSRLYDAGVQAARGLIDGLESLSERLDKAAARLGRQIANALRSSLGIKSPSRVMMTEMEHVGDGIALGLDAQHSKVGAAAARLSGQVQVSPEVARYAAEQNVAASAGRVSGNGAPINDIDVTIVTPTEDPHAVAMETINELTARL